MSRVLFLPHRLPFPPNKGDKIRSHHLLEALRGRHEVHVGTFVDDPADFEHVPALRERCASLHVERLRPLVRRLASARALLTGGPLTNAYYADAGMHRWVRALVRQQRFDAIVAFSSSMAQYVPAGYGREGRVVVDFVDIDSDKWRQYAARQKGPGAVVYAREARTLERFEVEVATAAHASLFVSEREAATFRELVPARAASVLAIRNGVDARYFDPAASDIDELRFEAPLVVFTGAMDYWANVEGVQWFTREVWPALRARHPGARFYIVGSRPAPEVQALAREPDVFVTGFVPDVRPYLRAAHAVVAPLRIARGVQNKVLEAMAMARPLVCTPLAVQGLDFATPSSVRIAAEPGEFVARTSELLAHRAAVSAPENRDYVLRFYDWTANLAEFLDVVDGARPPAAGGDA